MKKWIRHYVGGLVYLALIIAVNGMATYAGLLTWHPFLREIYTDGLTMTLQTTSLPSFIFLFIIYPFILYYTFMLITRKMS